MNNINSNTIDIEQICPNQSDIKNASISSSTNVDAMMDAIISMLQKMNSDIRDMQRDFFASQQSTAFKKELTAISTKQDSIQLNYKAALSNAIAKTTSGVVSIGGAGFGMAKGASLGGEFISAGTNGIGKMVEGSVSVSMASTTRDAQKKQLLGDFQSNSAIEYHKLLSNTADKASEASKRMLDITREIISLQERITSSVRM
ncbi:hypothetical protein PJ702_003973 [Providencia rettgeri]|nr:hypothetical protein [Providencia rettgeri]